jgi:2-polyprenyl-6-methoxyphenol hydroxylase-like FAD-dependent oxidoreductase
LSYLLTFDCGRWSTGDVETLPESLSCDVLIVGYGPVGIICSALLAQRGIDVVAVERHPERYKFHRAGHIDGETMRTFQSLGVAEAIELVAQPIMGMQLRAVDGELLTTLESGLSGAGWKADYLAYQPEYEVILDERGRELGSRVFMGYTAESLTQDADGVRTVVRATDDSSASLHTISSRYVIGADGPKSFVRSAIGSQRIDLGFKSMPELVVDFEWADPDLELPGLPDACHLLDIERPTLAGRWGGRRWARWEFAAQEGESLELLESEENCWNLLARWGVTPAHGTIIRRAVFNFESSVASAWRVGHTFLMGDAAHTAPPYMGQGLLSGIRDAVNLSWKLAATLRGEASEALLDSYQIEREPHARELIAMACAQGNMILTRDPVQAAARNEMLRSNSRPPRVFPRLTTGIVRGAGVDGAPDGIGSVGRPGLQARVALDKRVDRLDEFVAPGWRIVSRHPIPMDLFNQRQSQLLEALDVKFAHISRGAHGDTSFFDIDAEFDTWYRRTDRRAFLERPDHYVFGTAERIEDIPALIDDLADALAANGWYLTPDGPGTS